MPLIIRNEWNETFSQININSHRKIWIKETYVIFISNRSSRNRKKRENLIDDLCINWIYIRLFSWIINFRQFHFERTIKASPHTLALRFRLHYCVEGGPKRATVFRFYWNVKLDFTEITRNLKIKINKLLFETVWVSWQFFFVCAYWWKPFTDTHTVTDM